MLLSAGFQVLRTGANLSAERRGSGAPLSFWGAQAPQLFDGPFCQKGAQSMLRASAQSLGEATSSAVVLAV